MTITDEEIEAAICAACPYFLWIDDGNPIGSMVDAPKNHPCRGCKVGDGPHGGTAGCRVLVEPMVRAAILAYRAALAKQGKKKVRWINLYPPYDTTGEHPWRTTSWLTRELADRHARPGRIACCRVAFNDGDGLMRDAAEGE